MSDNTIDGTPDAVKVACPVWSGGKGSDYLKALPITITKIIIGNVDNTAEKWNARDSP